MQTRLARVVVPVATLLVGCGAAFWSWQVAQHVDQLQQTGDQTFARIDRVQELLDEIADRELTYASTGHVERSALEATSKLLQRVADDCGSLATGSLTAAVSTAREIADTGTLIGQINARGQENLVAGLDLTAADLTFTETQQARRALRHQLRAQRTAVARALTEARSEGLTQVWMGLASVALLFAWVLIRGPRTKTAVSSPSAAALPSHSDDAELTMPPPADLRGVAAVCTALGQLKSDADLPSLLDRSVAVLGASGLVVWIAAGEELFPASGVGYDPAQLNRLGPIPRTAANPTAAAWRTGSPQTLEGDAGDAASRSALVVPMLGTEGCIGVLAIELDRGRETDPSTQSLATLIAAQLGAVLAPGPAASSPPADVLSFERSVRA